MRTPENIAKLRALLTSADDVEFFLNNLKTADWIPLLEEVGLLEAPPAPIESDSGTMFPFWFVSRYLVRVADQEPEGVAAILYRARDSKNPRVWWDTVDALVKMPAEYTDRFAPFIKRWVHHPWRLGLDKSTSSLVGHLVAGGSRDTAIDLGTDLARLVPPDERPEEDLWTPLDDYDYGEYVPPTARALATFGPEAVYPLVVELERFLAIEYPNESGGRRTDASFIWRPAIEDHEQNWDHDLDSKLVHAIRDGFETVLAREPGEVGGIVGRLLGSGWPIVRRLGLHLLVEHGGNAADLVEAALTDRALLDDEHHRHELYRLLTKRFSTLRPQAKATFLANVRSVAAADDEAATARREGDETRRLDPGVIRDVIVRRWFSAIADHLEEPDRKELDGIVARLGSAEEHPDFASYHMSWSGSTSPLSKAELIERSPEDLLTLLATWAPPDRFGPGPSVDGLRNELADAVEDDPAKFAALAPRFVDLSPAYVGGLLHGLEKAIKAEKTFPWDPVFDLISRVLDKRDEDGSDSRDHTWNDVRSTVARLLRDGLDDTPARIPLEDRDGLWSILVRLAADPEPTAEGEARYGPPNMDPVTYSLNTIRSSAFHAIFTFLVWHRRQVGGDVAWSLTERDPEAVAVLDAHLDPEVDPSVAVRAAYGWWLPWLIDLDRDWVASRAPRIIGRVSTALERAAWDGFLFRGRGRLVEHELLGVAYRSFAEQLATLDKKPPDRPIPGDVIERFLSHLILPWLHHPEVRDRIPLDVLLGSGKAWLVGEVVETAGHMLRGAKPEQVTEALAAAYRDLWALVLELSSNLDADGKKAALGPFVWWFESPLPGDWALEQLVALMDRDILPDPDFAVFRRLPDLAQGHPDETLRVVEVLAGRGDREWTLRTQEAEIRQVLLASIDSPDDLQRERVEVLVHRLVRLGLRGLASLRRTTGEG